MRGCIRTGVPPVGRRTEELNVSALGFGHILGQRASCAEDRVGSTQRIPTSGSIQVAGQQIAPGGVVKPFPVRRDVVESTLAQGSCDPRPMHRPRLLRIRPGQTQQARTDR
jgi:hypothetical protein